MPLRLFLAVTVFAVAARSADPVAEEATRHLPEGARLVVRFAAAERLDAVGAELKGLWDLTGERRPLSGILSPDGTADLGIDPKKPYYFSFDGKNPEWLFVAREGATWPEPTRRAGALVAMLADGHVRIGVAPEGARRGTPFPIVPADLSVAIDVKGLLALVPPEGWAELDKLERGGAIPAEWLPDELMEIVPPEFQPLAQSLMEIGAQLGRVAIRDAQGIDSIHYACTWREGRILTEGWVRTLERSALRGWLERAGKPAPHALAGYLPKNALYVVDSQGIGSWLDTEIRSFFDEAWGEGAGRDALLFLGPSFALSEHLTGRGAGAVVLSGMSGSMRSIWEVKEGAPIAEAIAKLDATSLNKRFARTNVPLRAALRLNDDSDGETVLHRMDLTSDVAEAAFAISNMQFCFAVEGRYLLTTQSMNPKGDLLSFLARVRAGDPGSHPHLEAMARLAPEGRHEGISFNIGAVKPTVAPFLMMAPPDLGQVVLALPDELWLSTALGVENGHIRVRGDWPVAQFLEIASKLK